MEREKWHPDLFLQWSRVLTKGLKKPAKNPLTLKKKVGKIECRRTRKKKTQKDKSKCLNKLPCYTKKWAGTETSQSDGTEKGNERKFKAFSHETFDFTWCTFSNALVFLFQGI